MADNESIGGISVDIIGDYSHLIQDLSAANDIAAKAGADIAESFNSGAAGADNLSKSIGAAGEAAQAVEQQISGLAGALEQVQSGIGALGAGIEEAGSAATAAAEQMSGFSDATTAAASGVDAFGESSTSAASATTQLSEVGDGLSQSLTEVGTVAATVNAAIEQTGESANTAAGQMVAFDEALAIPSDAVAGIAAISDGLQSVVPAAQQAAAGVQDLGQASTEAAASAGQLGLFESELSPVAAVAESAAVGVKNLGESAVTVVGAMTDAGSSARTFEEQIQELVDSGATLNEALTRVMATSAEFGSGLEDAGSAASATAGALDEVGAAGEAVGAGLGAAGSAASVAAQQLELFDEAAMVPYADAAGQLNLFADAIEPIGPAAQNAAKSERDFADEAEHAGESAHHAEEGLAGLAEKMIAFGEALAVVEGLREFAAEALHAADDLQRLTISLEVTTGSAEKTKTVIEELEKIGVRDGLSMPALEMAATRMYNLLGASAPVPEILEKVANGAAVMGTSIEAASAAFTRLANTSSLGARQLTPVGLSLQSIADAMNEIQGTADKTTKNVAEFWKEMDQAEHIEVLTAALEKLDGVASRVADTTFGGKWAQIGAQMEEVWEQLGKSIMAVIGPMTDFVHVEIMPFLQSLVQHFNALPEPVRNTAVAVTLLVPAVAALGLSIGGLGIGLAAAGGAIAEVGLKFAVLGEGIAGATASYGVMVASGVLTVATWVALAAAILEVAYAYVKMKDAQELAAASGKNAADSLASYEIALKQHGIDISELQKQYGQGLLTTDQYIADLGKLRDEYLKTHPVAQAHAESTRAVASASELAALKMQSLKDAVASTWKGVQDVNAKYQEHKATLGDVAAAYDKWIGATNALKGAQQALLPVVTNAVIAYKEFDAASMSAVSAQDAVANKITATNVVLGHQSETLEHAQTGLRNVLAQYEQGLSTWDQVAKALKNVNDAQKAIDATWDSGPKIAPAMKDLALSAVEAEGAFAAMAPAVIAINTPLSEAYGILSQMHVKLGENATDIDTLAKNYLKLDSVPHTVEMIDAAWQKVSGSINKLAKTDLPTAIALMQAHIAKLQDTGAAQGEIYEQQRKMLELEIHAAEQRGKDATDQILALHQVKLAQEALSDQSRLMGDLVVGIEDDIIKGWDQAGKAIADCIVDGKNFGEAMKAVGKDVIKLIMEDLVGTAFKAMKDALIGLQGKVMDISKSFEDLAKTVAKDVGGYADDAAGPATKIAGAGAGGASGGSGILSNLGNFASVLTAITTLINGIIQDFQLAHLNKTMGLVEANTRFLEIKFAKFAEADEWQRHDEVLSKWDMAYTRWGDIWAELIGLKAAINMTDSAGQFEWLWTQQSAMMVGQYNSYVNLLTKANGYLSRIADVMDPSGAAMPGTQGSKTGDVIKDNGWLWTQMQPMMVAQFNSNQSVFHSIDDRLKTGVDTYLKNIDASTAASKVWLVAIGGALGGIPKFATGTSYVPHDMLAVVHQGEAIIPAAQVAAATEATAIHTVLDRPLDYSQSTTTTAQTQPAASPHIGMFEGPQAPMSSLPTVLTGSQFAQMATTMPSVPSSSNSSTMLASMSGPQPISTGNTYGAITQNVDVKVYESSNPRETARQLALTLKTLTGRLGPGTGS